jgi:hypothetical protein
MNNFAEFEVKPNHVTIACLVGLNATDTYLVEYRAEKGKCLESPSVYIPFSPNGCQWRMTASYNPAKFDTPGHYRIVPEGAPALGVSFNSQTYYVMEKPTL